MWERMLDGLVAVLFAAVSALICSYVIVCTGMGSSLGKYVLPVWGLLGAFAVIYGAVLATSRPHSMHYVLLLPTLLWVMSVWESIRLQEQGMELTIKCAGAGINLLCLCLVLWRRTKKKR